MLDEAAALIRRALESGDTDLLGQALGAGMLLRLEFPPGPWVATLRFEDTGKVIHLQDYENAETAEQDLIAQIDDESTGGGFADR